MELYARPLFFPLPLDELERNHSSSSITLLTIVVVVEDEDVPHSPALNETDGAEAQASHNGDAPGKEGCNDEGGSPSNKDEEAVPRTRVSSRF